MTIAVYTGRFEPVTDVEIDLIRRAYKLFGTVVVGVAHSRSASLTIEERIRALREAFDDLDGVSVEEISGLSVDFAREHDATVLVRGICSTADFDYESDMARMNYEMAPELETVYLPVRR